MSEFSHLDQLEAEAIYIMREVAAECERPVMLYSIASGNEGILSGKAAIPVPARRYHLEVQGND